VVYSRAMAIPDDLTPIVGPDPTLAPRESAPPKGAARPGPLPSPAPAAPAGSLVLQTSLFGPLRVPDGAGRAAELEELSRRAAVYATRARGDGTRRAYRSAWRQFEAWCASLGREPLAADPDTLAMYVVRCADQGFAVSSRSACTSRRSAPPTCSPASRSTCATRASPWSWKVSPGPAAHGRAARPPPRCPACCA